ncbi:hypothetical protein ABEG18_03505 [Alsobacter sp. KACC 23698]|uniref:Uncharacterized protein n=1 Tax=Alsobacter sp. KACC 23698 TaxID=3149229 RepID=A0AAU7JI84_9HYPH
MDVTVSAAGDAGPWMLTDLLGRSMGRVVETQPAAFAIEPDGFAVQTMEGCHLGPHRSLDAALAEIERHTRGVCRRGPAPPSDRPEPDATPSVETP